MASLHDKWLCDQKLAFSAAILSSTDLNTADLDELDKLGRAIQIVAASATKDNIPSLSDPTLALLKGIPRNYERPDPEIFRGVPQLSYALSEIRSETELREGNDNRRISSLLIAYAVYLLKQPHLSIRDFLKWFKRNDRNDRNDRVPPLRHTHIGQLLRKLEEYPPRDNAWDQMDELLEDIRDTSKRTDDRSKKVDELYSILLDLIDTEKGMLWWLRICLSLKRSLYFWPLMVAGENNRLIGISYPIGLFLSQDGKGKIYFRDDQGNEWESREKTNGKLRWNREWGASFWKGLEAAKEMWRTQNGRLRFVDKQQAENILNSSLVVDTAFACAITDSFFEHLDGQPYFLSGRSAEAYWCQAVLGLLLPGGQIPLGVATGRIEKKVDGGYDIHGVEGLKEKLKYASNVGFPRLVLPVDVMSNESIADEINALKSRNIEINYCKNVRHAADAMQISGWRRTAFVQLPETRDHFSHHLHRLHLWDQTRQRESISQDDKQFYQKDEWKDDETDIMETLDHCLLDGDGTEAIKFVDRGDFERRFQIDAESIIGKWLAWSDHQVRKKNKYGYYGPGLGILCIRTTEHDMSSLSSMIANVLFANSEWWDTFQYSNRDRAAQLLARLLGNSRAAPSICSSSAPDLLVLFDEGNLTRRPTDPFFPDGDFSGHWLDLLNPNKGGPQALNKALLQLGNNSLGNTRIIIVHGQPDPSRIVHGQPDRNPIELLKELGPDDKEYLERLAVFRFGFSIQAAYSIIGSLGNDQSLSWTKLRVVLRRLRDEEVLHYTRGQYYIPSLFLSKLRKSKYWSKYWNDPDAHFRAARALTPILDPSNQFIASNYDRTMEPELLLDSTWHLRKGISLLPRRDQKSRSRYHQTLSHLIFLRPFADWYTVGQLRRHPQTLVDAVQLGRKLLKKEKSATNNLPRNSRIVSLLQAIGRSGQGLEKDGPNSVQQKIAELADEATNICTEAIENLSMLSLNIRCRQKCKLLSEYVYCMRMLKISDTDPRLTEPLKYLNETIRKIVKSDCNVYDFPLSYGWLKASWQDPRLSQSARSLYAYCATRVDSALQRDEIPRTSLWVQPWIEYFSLLSTENFNESQLKSALTTWNEVYGRTDESAHDFGQRVLYDASYRPKQKKRKTSDIPPWGKKIRLATDNLWDFVAKGHLQGDQADIALRFIRVVVMPEILPAFDFVMRRDEFSRWPNYLGCDKSSRELKKLAYEVIRSKAGWINMLSSFDAVSPQDVELVKAWKRSNNPRSSATLYGLDPENLLKCNRNTMALVDKYHKMREKANRNARQLLKKSIALPFRFIE